MEHVFDGKKNKLVTEKVRELSVDFAKLAALRYVYVSD